MKDRGKLLEQHPWVVDSIWVYCTNETIKDRPLLVEWKHYP